MTSQSFIDKALDKAQTQFLSEHYIAPTSAPASTTKSKPSREPQQAEAKIILAAVVVQVFIDADLGLPYLMKGKQGKFFLLAFQKTCNHY
jgi:hypothetical protein